MKNIFIITVGPSNTGSTKFRIKQYEDFFLENGFKLLCVSQQELGTEHFEQIKKADLVINQKCLLDGKLAKKIFGLNPRVLFDFDDSIYTRPGKPYSFITRIRVQRRLKLWLSKSIGVITANKYLQQFAFKYTSRGHVIPMALNLDVWKPINKGVKKEIVIGWAGAPGNLHHLEKLEPVLSAVLKKYPNVRLAVYSGKKPRLSCNFDYFPFEDGTEHRFIQNLDIGLLPLTDEEYSRGKSPIKAIQYLSCGVPVIGNIFGATAEILNPENSIVVNSEDRIATVARHSDVEPFYHSKCNEYKAVPNKIPKHHSSTSECRATELLQWENAIEKLIHDEPLRKQMGQAGRRHMELKHCFNKTKVQFLELVTQLCQGDRT